MFNPITAVQQIWKPAPVVTEELAMLGDLIEVVWGSYSLIGIVTEGDPLTDSFGDTWFKVEGVVMGRYDRFTASTWTTDSAVIRIIQKA